MVIGTSMIELHLPGAHSLKDKRRILKSLMARLHKEFNVSCGEIELHETWQSAIIGVAVVSTEAPHANRVLNSVVNWIELHRPDLTVVDHTVEIIH
ncbi:MAG TPA: DUF503 domain-containing protein [Chloroflexi bacterium]|nr:DUF503 domain-containing protein [Chloroflexota bacterium]